MASLPTLSEGIALTHFIVAADVDRPARFYSHVLGGEPTIVALETMQRVVELDRGLTWER